jgi:hypothetical protein
MIGICAAMSSCHRCAAVPSSGLRRRAVDREVYTDDGHRRERHHERQKSTRAPEVLGSANCGIHFGPLTDPGASSLSL